MCFVVVMCMSLFNVKLVHGYFAKQKSDFFLSENNSRDRFSIASSL